MFDRRPRLLETTRLSTTDRRGRTKVRMTKIIRTQWQRVMYITGLRRNRIELPRVFGGGGIKI